MSLVSELSNAKWIWTNEEGVNQYAGFLKEVELESDAAELSIAIHADLKYKLYVNGQFVNAGPAPFRKPVIWVDEYDLSPYLRKGTNTIFALCFYFGEDTKYGLAKEPGLIAAINGNDDGKEISFTTDSSWQSWILDCWARESIRKTWAIEYVEDIDLNDASYAVVANYATEDYMADNLPELPACSETRESELPGMEFRPRMTPYLRWRNEECRNVTEVYRCQPQVVVLRDAKGNMDHERIQSVYDVEKYQILKSGVPSFERREGELGFSFVYDFRRICAGDFLVELTVDEPTIIDIGFTELFERGRPNIGRSGGNVYFTRMHLKAGKNRCRLYNFNGFRYLYLVIREAVGTVTIDRVETKHCRGDLDYIDDVKHMDRNLAAIYDISRRSTMLNAQAYTYDCNSREQGAYWGDSIWIAETIGQMTGDFSYMKHLAFATRDELEVFPMVPPSLYGIGGILYDYSLIPPVLLKRYHDYTGDTDSVKELLATMEKVIENFRPYVLENGLIDHELIPNKDGGQNLLFLDHAGLGWHLNTTTSIDRRSPSAGLNLYFAWSLQSLDGLRKIAGQETAYEEEVSSLLKLIRERFYNPSTGLLVDAGTPEDGTSSQIVNSLAVLTGLFSGDEARLVLSEICNIEQNTWISQGSPYSYFLIFEALVQAGIPELGLEVSRKEWRYMLEHGATTTWETFVGERHDSLNHAWSAPLPALLSRGIAGIMPAEPGCRKIEIRPVFTAFDRFAATFCILQGTVSVEWRRLTPDSWAVRAIAPEGVDAVLCCGDGREEFSGIYDGNVTLS